MSVTLGFRHGINELFAMVGCQAVFTVSYRRFGTSPIHAESHPRTSKTSWLFPLYEFHTVHVGSVPDSRPSVRLSQLTPESSITEREAAGRPTALVCTSTEDVDKTSERLRATERLSSSGAAAKIAKSDY